MSDITTQDLIDAAESAGYEWRWYSGRAMYGELCFAITPDKSDSSIKVVLTLVYELLNSRMWELTDMDEDGNDDCVLAVPEDIVAEVTSALEAARTDTMGLGEIIYWPAFKDIEIDGE